MLTSLTFIRSLRIGRNAAIRNLYKLSQDEEDLLCQSTVGARVVVKNLLKVIEGKEEMEKMMTAMMKTKDKLSTVLRAEANTRFLKISGDLSIRRLIEESEQETIVRSVKKSFKEEQERALAISKESKIPSSPIIRKLTKVELWDRVFNSDEAKDRFPNLSSLQKELAVPSLLRDLFNFSSKRVHTMVLRTVFIDTEEYTPAQVFSLWSVSFYGS